MACLLKTPIGVWGLLFKAEKEKVILINMAGLKRVVAHLNMDNM